MQVVNHGVNLKEMEELRKEVEGFFKLPLEEKMKYKIRAGDVEGYGTVIRSQDQKRDWNDRFYMTINPLHKIRPHLFPQLPSSLRFLSPLSLSHQITCTQQDLSIRLKKVFYIFIFY